MRNVITMAALAAALTLGPAVLPGCGGGGGSAEHPAEVEASDVAMPEDIVAGMARLTELIAQLEDPLKVGKDLHLQRPVADEIAIVAEGLAGVSGKSHPPAVVANIDAKGKGIAKEARRLADALRKKDAKTARIARDATAGLVTRLQNELPKKPADGEDG
jgi:hypothetical protein